MADPREAAIATLRAIASDATVDAAVRVRASELLLSLPDGSDDEPQHEDPHAAMRHRDETRKRLAFRASGGLVPRVNSGD
jgi:hypothetical protein